MWIQHNNMTFISIKLNMFVGFTHKFFCCNEYMMAESHEDKFKTELYKKCEVCRKVLLSKDAYFTMLEYLKTVAADTVTKNRHGYYLPSK